jgi:precorrin-8X/cobalt-precorrin-8 methylmutase
MGTRMSLTKTETGMSESNPLFDYVRDPEEIYRRSFATVRAEAELGRFSERDAKVVVRLIHACGMVDIAEQVGLSDGASEAGVTALGNGCPLFVDAEMVGAGIIRKRLVNDNPVICTLNDPSVPAAAKTLGTTRSAAAVDLWQDQLAGSIAVFGNAPTALFRLLEIICDGGPKPALILGFPVGFIGAAESKAALVEHAGDVPFITLTGRRGGSAIAAAAVNAIAGDLG